jgi:hemolysin activation/secretion protein
LFGSYDCPIVTPRLRLNLYAGVSDFDISGGGGIDFLGRGSFYGAILRLNVFQVDGWGLHLTTSLSHENSRVTPSLFKTLETDIDMDLWTVGLDLRRSDDTSNTSVAFYRVQSVDGSDKSEFLKARDNTDPHFDIYTLTAAHSRYLDPNNVHRLSGSFRWITSNKRLAPSKMTTFGGLYSVRGYKEDEVVADGGVLVSAQYEFDLLKSSQSGNNAETGSAQTAEKPHLRKLALLCFTDLAQAKTITPVPGEDGTQEMWSVGIGTSVALGDNFDAGIYYGWPLISTTATVRGHGRWNFSIVLRW